MQDNAIPDVKTTDPFGKAIYMLYRAGVLIGNDEKGTFASDSYIRRVEVAAITTRMAQPALRQSIKLVNRSYDPGIYYLPIYTISYKDEGDADFSGTHEGVAPNTHTYGIATTLKRATKSGNYAFGGWYTTSDCSGSAVTSLGATDYTADITLYAKWIDTTGFTFKAVYDTTDDANVLTLYYDNSSHSADGTIIKLYDSLPTAATSASDWGYHNVREGVKRVAIDESVRYYTGLTSTAYMFYLMMNSESITGAEYLNTANVTNMSSMFFFYGNSSTVLNAVPDVSNWGTANVTNMSRLFEDYGISSTALNALQDVSKWNTAKVTDMSHLFEDYGTSSTALNAVPDVSDWETAAVTNMGSMFRMYGGVSTALNTVPDVSKWNTAAVTNIGGMFASYGQTSTALNFTLNLSGWNLESVTTVNDPIISDWKVFNYAGFKAATWDVTIPAKTGEKPNTQSTWYVGDGTKFIAPAADKTFSFPLTEGK